MISASLFLTFEVLFHQFISPPTLLKNMFKIRFQARASRWRTFLVFISNSFGDRKKFWPIFQPSVSYKGCSYKKKHVYYSPSSWYCILRPCANDQKLMVKHLRFAYQAMLDRLATSPAWQDKCVYKCFGKVPKHFLLFNNKKMFDKQCFVTWPNDEIFCLTNKFQMFYMKIQTRR